MNSAVIRTFITRNDLPIRLRETMISLLNQSLADTFDLYSQVKQAHWNVKGMQFIQLHLLFDELANGLIEYVDLIAERATALGGVVLATVRSTAASSNLPEYPKEIVEDKQVLEVLAMRYGEYGSSIRVAIDTATEEGDHGTMDVFTGISRTVDKHLWLLDAHIQE